MIMSLVLFENEFLNIVAISFTALVINELIMVALEITTWYVTCFATTVPFAHLSMQAYLHGHFRDSHVAFLRYQHRILT